MTNPCGTSSIEYNDNRIALYVAQKGKCAISKVKLEVGEIDCHHKLPIEFNGGDEYKNLVILSDKVHVLIHASNDRTIKKYLKLVNPNEQQLNRINQLRLLARMSEICA